MNYYRINNQCYFVDLPGFGYAKVSKKERQRWGRDIRQYLLDRKTIRLVVHLVDIRHEPTKLDEDFFYWLASNRLPFIVVLNKTDKLSKNKQAQSVSLLKNVLEEMNIEVPVVACSAKNKSGFDEIRNLLSEFLEM